MIKIVLGVVAAAGAGVATGLWAVGLAPAWAIPLAAVTGPMCLCAAAGAMLAVGAAHWEAQR